MKHRETLPATPDGSVSDDKRSTARRVRRLALPHHQAPALAGPGRPENAPGRRDVLPWIGSGVAVLTVLASAAMPGGATAIAGAAAGLAIAGACLRRLHLNARRPILDELARLKLHAEFVEDEAWELKESEERYRTLAEAFGDLVMHRDSEGRVLFANDALAAAFGRTQPEMTGEIFAPEILAGSNPAGEGSDHSGSRAREICLATPTGRRWFRWIDLPIRDAASGLAATRSVARDITDHKTTEQALEAARRKAESQSNAKSRFLATVSHEMRTPLNGILGMSQLLSDTRLTPEQTTYNDAIHSSGASLLALIEDMLDITRIEAGHFELKPQTCHPARLVEEVCELLAERAHGKNIELACQIGQDIPESVIADAGRIRQVLVNLLGNAVKFTDSGGVRISLAATWKDGTDGRDASSRVWLAFAVTDTGPGVAAADKGRIFDEFEQADSATTRKHGGAGLGLSISRGIVQKMGADIQVDSAAGPGTTFRFELDLPAAEPAAETVRLDGRRVLVVSPGPFEGPAIAGTILTAGGDAVHVSRLGEAGAILRKSRNDSPFNAIIMDAAISRDPSRSLRRLVSLIPGDPFAVILVEPGARRNLHDHLGNGFDAYLVRPVRRNSLLRVLCERSGFTEVDRTSKPVHRLLLPGETLARHRVLLAEDNEINALLARTVLERAGQSVTLARTGREALTAFRKAARSGKGYELVLMDLHMPVMDGADAIRAMRHFEEKTGSARARILVLSADEQASAGEESIGAGADGFLAKPVAPARIVAILRELSGRRTA
ncbi:MAG: ATP-binding protein [Pseudomonadota bacterium]|nr:ATP-binding protein [Pseudomonadota bacterium]